MASLSKQQLNLIANVVVKQVAKVSYKSNWQSIFALFEIGSVSPSGKHLEFLPKDWDLLREMALKDSGLDVLELDFDVPRQQMAQQSANEKYANISPDADHVLIKLAPNIIQSLLSRAAADPVVDMLSILSSSLRLKVDAAVTLCQRLNIAQLIVVENLDSFDNIFAYTFTPELQPIIDNCMVLYRGSHDYSPAGRKHFLHLVAALNLDVIAFTDLDPAGLMIANTLENCHSMIVPKWVLDAPNELLALKQVNSVGDFNKQHKQLTYLDNIMSQSTHNTVGHTSQWLTLAQWVGRNHVSIKQQHMLANALPLARISIDY